MCCTLQQKYRTIPQFRLQLYRALKTVKTEVSTIIYNIVYHTGGDLQDTKRMKKHFRTCTKFVYDTSSMKNIITLKVKQDKIR